MRGTFLFGVSGCGLIMFDWKMIQIETGYFSQGTIMELAQLTEDKVLTVTR